MDRLLCACLCSGSFGVANAWLGVDNGHVNIISSIVEASPAHGSLEVGDEIVYMDATSYEDKGIDDLKDGTRPPRGCRRAGAGGVGGAALRCLRCLRLEGVWVLGIRLALAKLWNAMAAVLLAAACMRAS